MVFRKAEARDIAAVAKIYELVHEAEERGELTVGWAKGVYPIECDARAALNRGDLFVAETDGEVLASAIINRIPGDTYEGAPWQYQAEPEEVMVLHTLCVSTEHFGKGIGRSFVEFYEEYAAQNNSLNLRIDTNERNLPARAMYKKLGYKEIAVTPCTFHSIEGVNLVLLEKKLEDKR